MRSTFLRAALAAALVTPLGLSSERASADPPAKPKAPGKQGKAPAKAPAKAPGKSPTDAARPEDAKRDGGEGRTGSPEASKPDEGRIAPAEGTTPAPAPEAPPPPPAPPPRVVYQYAYPPLYLPPGYPAPTYPPGSAATPAPAMAPAPGAAASPSPNGGALPAPGPTAGWSTVPASPPAPASPPVPAAPKTKEVWYGWQNLLADGGAILLTIGAAAAAGSTPDDSASTGLGFLAVGSLLFASPAVHWAHGDVRKGFGALGLNVGGPTVCGLIGGALAARTDSANGDYGGLAVLAGGALGSGVGLLAAYAVDAAVLAYEDVPDPNPSVKTTWVPTMQLGPSGGTVGIVGTF